MSSSNEIVQQDPDAHSRYEVDWEDWLVNRGYLADGSQIDSIVWKVPSPLVLSFQSLTGAIARVFIKNVPNAQTFTITSTINMPEPSLGVGIETDDFSFRVRGNNK